MRQFHLIPLLSAHTYSAASEKFEEAGLAMLQDLDDLGLIDWQAHNEEGLPFLHALVEQRERVDVLTWVLDRYGPDLLTQTDRHGRTLMDMALRKKHTQSLVLFTEQATVEQMAWHDQPGESWGEGWYQRFRVLNQNEPLAALGRRGITPEADAQRLARTVQHLTTVTLDLLLERGIDPGASIEIAPGFRRPLWAQAIDRHIPVSSRTHHLPQHSDIAIWEELRQKSPSQGKSFVAKDHLLKNVQELSQKMNTRDDLGRPALWLAAVRNPGLIGDSLNRHGDVFRERDHQGHGFWFHAYPLLNESEWKASQWLPELPSAMADQVHGQGLVAQWFTTPAASFSALSLPFAKSPGSLGASLTLAQDWASAPALWAMDGSTTEQVAQVWLEGKHPALKGLAGACATWLAPWNPRASGYMAKTFREASRPGIWQGLVASPEWAALRAPMAVLLWRKMVVDVQAELKRGTDGSSVLTGEVSQALEVLCGLQWRGLPPAFVETWATHVQASPELLHPLGDRLGHQMRAVNREVALQDRPILAPPPRPRRLRV